MMIQVCSIGAVKLKRKWLRIMLISLGSVLLTTWCLAFLARFHGPQFQVHSDEGRLLYLSNCTGGTRLLRPDTTRERIQRFPEIPAPAWSALARAAVDTAVTVEDGYGWPCRCLGWCVYENPLAQPDGLALAFARATPDSSGARELNDFVAADSSFSADRILQDRNGKLSFEGLRMGIGAASKPVGIVQWGILVGGDPGDRAFRTFDRYGVLPLRPMCKGLVIDWILAGLTWAVMIFLWDVYIMRRRCLRGRCYECGYPLDGAGRAARCSECGAQYM
jgi:hypothetical protein